MEWFTIAPGVCQLCQKPDHAAGPVGGVACRVGPDELVRDGRRSNEVFEQVAGRCILARKSLRKLQQVLRCLGSHGLHLAPHRGVTKLLLEEQVGARAALRARVDVPTYELLFLAVQGVQVVPA